MCWKLLTNLNKHYDQTILFLVIYPQESVHRDVHTHTHTHTHTLKNLYKEIQSSFIHDIQKRENSPGVHFTVVEWLKIQWCLPQQKTTQQEKWTNSWYIQKRGWLSKSLSYVKKKKRMKSFTWRLYTVDFIYM